MQMSTSSKMPNRSNNEWYAEFMSSILRHSDDDGEYIQKPFGKALRHLRKRRRLTQGQLADAVGVAGHSTVATWELRVDPLDNDEMMERLARVLGVSVDYLAEGKVPSKRIVAAAFDEAIEQVARTYMSGPAAERAITVWRVMHELNEEGLTTVETVVRALAAKAQLEMEAETGEKEREKG